MDWICRECCQKDKEYEDVKRVLSNGFCERCEKEDVPLFKPRDAAHEYFEENSD